MEKIIKALSKQELTNLVKQAGQPAFRVKQLIEWLYVHPVSSYNAMSNLPQSLRDYLAIHAPLTQLELADRQISKDGTRKYLFQLHDGNLVETVAIPSLGKSNRLTICFSTQVGCAMGCIFCATGQQGFTRNLGMGEIIDQILFAQNDMNMRVSNMVGMGQGEPFLNYEQVLDALHTLNDPKGIAIGARKITVSTCGIIEGINRFALEPCQFTLAISLHAARQEVRDMLMPHAASQPLIELKRALRNYIAKTNRRITFEYTMISEVNDNPEDLQALVSYCKDLLCHINFLQINDIPSSPFKPTSPQVLNSWMQTCEQAGIPVSLRNSRGSDINGACGQLKNSFTHNK